MRRCFEADRAARHVQPACARVARLPSHLTRVVVWLLLCLLAVHSAQAAGGCAGELARRLPQQLQDEPDARAARRRAARCSHRRRARARRCKALKLIAVQTMTRLVEKVVRAVGWPARGPSASPGAATARQPHHPPPTRRTLKSHKATRLCLLGLPVQQPALRIRRSVSAQQGGRRVRPRCHRAAQPRCRASQRRSMADAARLLFASLESSVTTSFWTTLAQAKLDRLHLSEAPLDVVGATLVCIRRLLSLLR